MIKPGPEAPAASKLEFSDQSHNFSGNTPGAGIQRVEGYLSVSDCGETAAKSSQGTPRKDGIEGNGPF